MIGMNRNRMIRCTLALSSTVCASLLLTNPARALPSPDVDLPATAPAVVQDAPAVPADAREGLLGAGWRDSADRAWTTSGDASGFHLMVADADQGYAWHTVATLSDPDVETDSWIGNACLTGSGRRAVVTYAPRTFTNDSTLFGRGGFTAVVDLASGAVTPLPVRTSLAYFSPSCGSGEQAVLTQEGGADIGETRLVTVDAATATIAGTIAVPGQLTSPVPTAAGIIAADSGALVRVGESGARRVVATTPGVPFRVAADADGGVVYLERSGANRVAVERVADPGADEQTAATLATGSLDSVDVTSSHGGRVFITGAAHTRARAALPPAVSFADVPQGSQLSMLGDLALTSVLRTQADPRSADPVSGPQQVRIAATALRTGRQASFAVTPSGPSTATPTPNTPAPGNRATPRAAGGADPHDPSDLSERYCSVPREDPGNQAMQPRPRQVEWAVDQAVRNVLTVSRPANWKNLGMPAYTPQGLFPGVPLTGGGNVPAQIMLGVAAQESNLWEAARYAVPGMTADPLIGNYYGSNLYGTDPDPWDIHWDQADCGYGVTQVTDGMRLAGHEKPGEKALPYQTQRAVALDFAANVAAGVRILEQKWNETQAAGMKLNNDDPSKIENWFFAVWDYNSGFHPSGSGPWGLGWANNPANPDYPANREPFLETTYEDAAHPQNWPYPEKVLGWAGHPVQVLDSPNNLVAGYRAAWWNGTSVTGEANRAAVKPPVDQFCDASDDCLPGAAHLPTAPGVLGEPAGPCAHENSAGQYDLECWYHQSSTWKPDCSYTCGNELLRFDPGYAYQPDGDAYPPTCQLEGVSAEALVVNDVPDSAPMVRPGCVKSWVDSGTFTLTFAPDANGYYPGKIDTHQLGAGFGGHMWFTHTLSGGADRGGQLAVQGSWTLNQSHTGPMKVFVSLPDIGAQSGAATYTIKTAQGARTKVVGQAGNANRWVPLGTYMFDNVPEVDLTSVTPNGDGSQDIAFDAVAFVPITGTYHSDTVEADAQFDENQNIDAGIPASWLAGPFAGRAALYDWAMRDSLAITTLPDCTGAKTRQCVTPTVQSAISDWHTTVQSAGTDPVKHPPNDSIADWIGFANPAADRPASDQRPAAFDDDGKYKIKLKATISFVAAPDGTIVDGSQSADYEHRTGDTHIPKFVLDLIHAISIDYGIAPPDLTYAMPDLNEHDGEWTTVNPYTDGGVFPGRDYFSAGRAPVPVDSSGKPSSTDADCVAALVNGGGSIGYRPMESQSGPTGAFHAWRNAVLQDDQVAQPVQALADDIDAMFFSEISVQNGASIFNFAPPIWQELAFKVCGNDTVQPIAGEALLRSSYMPSQYLYFNGEAIGEDGKPTHSAAPLVNGDFYSFGNVSLPYGQCGPLTPTSPYAHSSDGSPWDIDPLTDPGIDPTTSKFCMDNALTPDPAYSG